MNFLVQNIIGGVIRHLLTAGGGALLGKGLIDGDQETQGIAAVMTLIGIAWSIYQKYSTHKSTLSADLTGATVKNIPVVNGGPLSPVK